MLKQTSGFLVPTAAAVTICLVIVYYFRSGNNVKRGKAEPVKKRRRKVTSLPAGLINIGNSCYLSSVVQLLAAVDGGLRKHFSGCGQIGKELAELMELINIEENEGVKRRPIRPINFVASFAKNSGFSSEQQDAHEFLLALLNLSCKEVLNRSASLSLSLEMLKVEDEPVFKPKDPFTGLLMSEFVCLPCAVGKKKARHVSSVKIEPFRCVTLPLGSHSIELGVMKYFCEPERVDDYVNYCGGDRCGLGAIRQKNCLAFPELLFLHLSVLSESFMKRDEVIKIDFELSGPGYRYELIGMIVHFGSTGHSGHFVCYRRRGRDSWIECNDASVKSVSRHTVQSQRPYILLYRLSL